MKHSLFEQIKLSIQKLGLEPGDRLPSERKFASELNISRNSLRQLLHTLQGRGLVDIRKGSGTFLKARFFSSTEFQIESGNIEPEKIVADQLETAFLFFPVIVELAGTRMDASHLEKLQRSNVALSRSIFSQNSQKVWMESLSFFRLIAQGTHNSFMINVMEEICSIDMAPFKHFFEVNQKIREQLFGDHVNILNALREKNCERAKQMTQNYVLHLSWILENRKDILHHSILSGYKQEII